MTDTGERKIALGDRSVKRLLALYNQAEGASQAAQAAIGIANQTASAFRQAAAAIFETNNLQLKDTDQLQFDLDKSLLVATEPEPQQQGVTMLPAPNGPARTPVGA